MIWFNMEIWRYFHSHSHICPFLYFLSLSFCPFLSYFLSFSVPFVLSFHSLLSSFLFFLLLLFRFGFCMINITIQWLNFWRMCVCVYELNNRTLKAKQSRFIAFHLPNILSFLSFAEYLHKHIFTDSFIFVTGKSERATSRNSQQATA